MELRSNHQTTKERGHNGMLELERSDPIVYCQQSTLQDNVEQNVKGC